eukprot:5996122-Ditylum_brightwellii.AAC.1
MSMALSFCCFVACKIKGAFWMSNDSNDDDLKITMKRMVITWEEQNHHGCCYQRRQRGSSCYGI